MASNLGFSLTTNNPRYPGTAYGLKVPHAQVNRLVLSRLLKGVSLNILFVIQVSFRFHRVSTVLVHSGMLGQISSAFVLFVTVKAHIPHRWLSTSFEVSLQTCLADKSFVAIIHHTSKGFPSSMGLSIIKVGNKP